MAKNNVSVLCYFCTSRQLTSLVQNRIDGAVEELRHHRHAPLEGDDVLRLRCCRHGCIVKNSVSDIMALAFGRFRVLSFSIGMLCWVSDENPEVAKCFDRPSSSRLDLAHHHCSPRCSPERCSLPGPLPPPPARGSSRPSSRPSMSSQGELPWSNWCRIALVSSIGTSGYLWPFNFVWFGRRAFRPLEGWLAWNRQHG